MGALLGIMHGLEGFETGPDWRGPLADRAINSSADGGYSINNCARIAYDLTNFGRQLAGKHAAGVLMLHSNDMVIMLWQVRNT